MTQSAPETGEEHRKSGRLLRRPAAFGAFRRLRIFPSGAPYTGVTDAAFGGESIKAVVYLDVLLLVNFLAAYFLLLAAGALGGLRAGFGRMLLGSGAAALSSLILFAPELPYPAQLLYKVGTALLVTAAAFGWRRPRRLLTAACWYAALNIALAGLAFLAVLRSGTDLVQTGNLTVYLRISPLLLVGLSGVCCLAVELGLRLLDRRKPAVQTVGLELELAGCAGHRLPPARPGDLPAGAGRQFCRRPRPPAGTRAALPARLVPGRDHGPAAAGDAPAADPMPDRCAKRAAAGVCGGQHRPDHRAWHPCPGARRSGVCTAVFWQRTV